MRHETAIFGPENPIQKFQLSFFGLFSSLSTTKSTIFAETPILIAFCKHKKRKIQKINLQHRSLKKQKFAPFRWNKKR